MYLHDVANGSIVAFLANGVIPFCGIRSFPFTVPHRPSLFDLSSPEALITNEFIPKKS
jgi:hypothetical protein